MGQEKRDFDFTVKLCNDFFKRKRIKKKFNKLSKIKKDDKIKITGWEIWWQVEFVFYLSNKKHSVSEWEREWQYPFDKRISSKNKMSIDFLVRQKHAKFNQYIALEFKQNLDAKACILGMLKDADKVYSMRQSASNIRSFWNIGIYKNSEIGKDEEVQKMIKKMILEHGNLSTFEDFIEIFQIGNTEFYYVIF